jgi:surface antigen
MSYQMESYFADKTPTGSVGKAAPALPPERDLAYAKAAASEVLKRGEKDASLDWENPTTGARGTVTPIAQAYSSDGKTCRDFLASYVQGSAQSWLKGEACKPDKGAWQVRSIKPWKSS